MTLPFLHNQVLNKFKIENDNTVYIGSDKLLYRYTVAIFIGLAFLTGTKQFVSDGINCYVRDSLIRSEYADLFCFVGSLFTEVNETKTYHEYYYQFVPYIFVLQAVLFYVPRLLWKSKEQGIIKGLTSGLKPGNEGTNKEKLKNHIREVFWRNYKKRCTYFSWYLFSELLSAVNLAGQMVALNVIFNGEFYTFSCSYFNLCTNHGNVNLFPVQASCVIPTISDSHTKSLAAFCVLPMNSLYQRIFPFIYLWLCFLCLVTIRSVMLNSGIFLMPIRKWMLACALQRKCDYQIERIIEWCSLGDFFFLYLIIRNVDLCYVDNILSDLENDIVKGKEESDMKKKMVDFV